MFRMQLAFATCVVLAATVSVRAQEEKVTYEDHVLPIFRAKCFACHNPDKKSGGLDLTNFTAMKAGGSSGEVVEAGDASSSYLWLVVNHESEPYMPPNSEKLPAPMLDVLKKWIDGGALETKDSKVVIKAKPKMEFSMSFSSTGRPEGPAPLPARLSLQPVVHTDSLTAVTSLATSPWAPLLAVGSQKQILLYNTSSLDLAGVLPFPEGEPKVLKFSRSGHLLLAGGGQGSLHGRVVVFNVVTGERIFSIGDELDSVLGADISSDHKYVALGGPQKVVRVYSTATGELVFESRKHTDWVTAASFSPDGVLLATGDRNGGIFVWEAETGREYLALRGHTGAISGFAWRPDSNVVASASEDTTVRTWEMENGNLLKSWGAHGGGTAAVWFTRENQIVSAGRDRTAKLWNQDGAAVRTYEAFGDLALAVAYCDETNRVIASDWSGLVRVWNAADGARLGELSSNPATLEMRLADASAALNQAQADAKTKTDTYNADQAVVVKTNTDLEATRKVLADLMALEKQLVPKVAEVQGVAADAKAKQDAAAKIVAELTPLVPAVKQAVAQAEAARPTAASDKELTAVFDQLKVLAAARETTLAAATKTATDEAARHQAAVQMVASLEKQIADGKAGMTTAQQTIEQQTAALAAAQTKAGESKALADQAAAAVAAAQQAVVRWQGEIEFTRQLAQLQEKKAEADRLEIAFATADAEMKAMQARIEQAQTAMNQAVAAEQAAVAVVATATEKVKAQVAARDENAKQLAQRETAAPMLKDAVDKATAAAAAMPDDKELAAAVEQLKAVVERNTKEAADYKAKADELTKTVAAAEQELTAAQEKVTAAKAVVADATKKVQDETAAAKPIEEKLATARQAFDQAQAAVNQLQQQVDGLKPQTASAT